MQIDTHNRATGNATELTGLKPSFLPKIALTSDEHDPTSGPVLLLAAVATFALHCGVLFVFYLWASPLYTVAPC
jgi:hypothetical protein